MLQFIPGAALMVVWSGNLHCDWTEGSRTVPGTKDIFFPEAVPFDRRQNAHRRDTRLLQGVVTQRGDGESACCSCWFPARVRAFSLLVRQNLGKIKGKISPLSCMSFITSDPAGQS